MCGCLTFYQNEACCVGIYSDFTKLIRMDIIPFI